MHPHSRLTATPTEMPKRVYQAWHLAREFIVALATRPISEANKNYTNECVESLESIRETLAAAAGANRGWRAEIQRLLPVLDLVIAAPTRRHLSVLQSHLDGSFAYARQRWQTSCLNPREGILKPAHYDRFIIMCGPGIGVGDEINFYFVLDALSRRFPEAAVEVYTFFPGIWKSMAPGSRVRTLRGRPLRAFERIDSLAAAGSLSNTLSLFVNYPGQAMFSVYRDTPGNGHFAEYAVGRGDFHLNLPGTPVPYYFRSDSATTPNQSHAMTTLIRRLFGRSDAAQTAGQAVVVHEKLGRALETGRFRLFLNPFTSKHTDLEPDFWKKLILTVRRQLPDGIQLECAVYPGLSEFCWNFSAEIIRQCRESSRWRRGDEVFEIRDHQGNELAPPRAVGHTFEAIRNANFAITIDTFSAHLCAFSDTPTYVVCLTRNPGFWEPAEHTLWVDQRHGLKHAQTLIRMMFQALGVRDGGPGIPSREKPIELPESFPTRPGRRFRERLKTWADQTDSLWNSFPEKDRNLMVKTDQDFAWPFLYPIFRGDFSPGPQLQDAAARYRLSIFSRLLATTLSSSPAGENA